MATYTKSLCNVIFMLGFVVVWWIESTNAKIYQTSKLTTNSAVRTDSMLIPCHSIDKNKLKCNQKVEIKVWMDLQVKD